MHVFYTIGGGGGGGGGGQKGGGWTFKSTFEASFPQL